jgi:FkbM family methyltransferase
LLETLNAKFPPTRSSGKSFIVAPKKCQGLVVWGPYQTLEPGAYDITFEIMPVEYKSPAEACCRIDVATEFGDEIIFLKDLTVGDLLAHKGKVTATFNVNKTSIVEYRVTALKGPGFRVRYFRKAHPAGFQGSADLREENNKLYEDNFRLIASLESSGINFAVDGDKLVASAAGLALEVRGFEDLQLLHEVFIINDYTVLPPGRCFAIDIGMNVGMASLALAKNPQIDTVFGYEPFAAPFEQALHHFKLNPDISVKIRPANIGLADREEELEVKSDPNSTIGVSIRGTASGNLERIRIRDAAEELAPKIEEAVARGLGVVMKVDCEGSEFAIFASLKRAALFDKIDAFMIEWHKWWSPGKTQADLIAPLLEAGYFVFDRTQPRNPHAGFLAAVRGARCRWPTL